jgi:hypothetical protein
MNRVETKTVTERPNGEIQKPRAVKHQHKRSDKHDRGKNHEIGRIAKLLRDAWPMRQIGSEIRFYEFALKFETGPQRSRHCQKFQNGHDDCETVGVQERQEAGGKEEQ